MIFSVFKLGLKQNPQDPQTNRIQLVLHKIPPLYFVSFFFSHDI